MSAVMLNSTHTCVLTFPGKTFVAGEYLALLGGPALLLSTEPRFALTVGKNSKAVEINPFHSNSPAGQLWSENKKVLAHFQFSFHDPYQLGGFGASSAQFALMQTVLQFQDTIFQPTELKLDWRVLLKDYRRLGAAEGFPPSGADMIGAAAGQLTFYDRQHELIETFAWPFHETEIFVAHTGHKLATHEHLKTLSHFEASSFETAMKKLKQAFIQVHLGLFIEALNDYRTSLRRNGWIAGSTIDKLQALESSADSGLLFAKGCGAMGSDVILALCEKAKAMSFRALLEQQGFKVFAGSSQISKGLQIQRGTMPSQDISLCL